MSRPADLINILISSHPLVAFAEDLFNGPPADFGVRSDAGWTRSDIYRLLASRGVQVWGLIYRTDVLTFTVTKAKAPLTYLLLTQAGIPIVSAPVKEIEHTKQQDDGQPPIGSIVTRLFNFLDHLA